MKTTRGPGRNAAFLVTVVGLTAVGVVGVGVEVDQWVGVLVVADDGDGFDSPERDLVTQ